MKKEIIFYKRPTEYYNALPIKGMPQIQKEIYLDTGSPITVISIPSLLQITGDSLSSFRLSVEGFLDKNHAIVFGGYDMKSNAYRYRLIPYIVNEVEIGATTMRPFMFWVNINNYKVEDAPTLFGMDYFHQGKKWFDEKDNIHIAFDKGYTCDTGEVGAALKQSGAILKLSQFKDDEWDSLSRD
ncbi:MAG: hypothetical protein IJ679_06465 [Lachnospiraceae bacterium]|nr:hypothetical protein [Lachnospiraceae bacterium]